MSKLQEKYLYSAIVIANTFLLAGCGDKTESTKDQCQRFTQVMQTVVDENQKLKQSSKFDKETLTKFINISQKAAKIIKNQPQFNDKSLVNFQSKFINLYNKYTVAGSNILKPAKIDINTDNRYSSLNIIKLSIPEEQNLLISFNDYCKPHGFKINNVAP
ncbi:hypothetical protein NIES2100_73410 [Calothrix sp. NIES-2100]|uniref:hypothetical protein n=1 Tax=Calothrix sp. NIES-2100 TaxID=1954172 RepID=UPI000B5EB2D1|nr:hypothetical protein NIES2100_73410 [Calothrix sp. NIES-2100]